MDLKDFSKTLGYPVRNPYPSENTYFKANPHVAGMATEDNKITLNPFSTLSQQEKEAVAVNEAYRLFMREKQVKPPFALTPEQEAQFKGTAYEKNPDMAKHSIIARFLSGDPSALNASDEQIVFAEMMRKQAQLRQQPPAKKD